MRDRHNFSGPITKWSKIKPMQSWITFKTQLNIILKGIFTKGFYLYLRCCLSLRHRHFTEKFLWLFVFEELNSCNTFTIQANNRRSIPVVRYIISKKPEIWKPNKNISCQTVWVSFYLYLSTSYWLPPNNPPPHSCSTWWMWNFQPCFPDVTCTKTNQ